MGFDSMAAWDATRFEFYESIQKRGKPLSGTIRFPSIIDYKNPRTTHAPPPFWQATSSWSPPASPTSLSPKQRVVSSPTPPTSPFELDATPAAPRPKSSHLITPPMTPKERHDLASKLYDASCAGDIDHMALLITLGAPVNGVVVVPNLYESFKPAKPGRLSPLAGAATFNQIEAAKLLLAHGAFLNPDVNQSSSSPLHQACHSDNIQMAQMLLELGANVDGQNCYKTTPLMYAVKYASAAMTSLILSYAPELEAESFMSSTSLFWGVWRDQIANVELCLQAGASPTHTMADGSTPLHCAAMSGFTAMAECLLRYGADPLQKNEEGSTPIVVARFNGYEDTARLIKRFAIERCKRR